MNNKILLTAALGTAIFTFACGRNEPRVVGDRQDAPVGAVVDVRPTERAVPVAEPVRESAWRPASSTPVRKVDPAPAPVAAAQPPARVEETRPSAPVTRVEQPTPAPVAERQPEPRQPEPRQAAPAPQPAQVTLATGSVIAVRVNEHLDSEKNHDGDTWTGALAEPIIINGMVIAEKGARAEGKVSGIERSGRVKGVGEISIELTSFQSADGQRVKVNTGSFLAKAKGEVKKDAAKVGIAAGIGAAIGAIAGGGKGAAIGAGAGGAAGTGVVLATRGKAAVINSEELIRFRVAEPVTITEKLRY